MRKVLGILMEFLYVSPMLFTSVIDPLHWMFAKAHADGVLAPLNLPPSNPRLSLHADDAALFITPMPEDVLVTKQLLLQFGAISGLVANLDKSGLFKIRCDNIDLPNC